LETKPSLTATSQKYLLAITAFWNKLLFLFIFFTFSLSLSAQGNLKGERLRLFNENFFAAQNFKLKGETEKAEALFGELYRIDSENATVCYELAQLSLSRKDQNDGLFYAERAMEFDPDNSWYMLLCAAIYKQTQMSHKQLNIYKKLLSLDREDLGHRYELAQAYIEDDQNELALAHIDTIENSLGVIESLIELKKVIYLKNNDVDGAASALQQLIDRHPLQLDNYGALGQLYQVNGRDEEALAIYHKMVDLDSNDPRPHLDLANYYRQINNKEASLHHLRKAMQSPLLDIERKIGVLISLFDASLKDTSLAKEAYLMLNDIVHGDAKDPRIFAMYGDYLSRDGRDTEAIGYYKKALLFEQKFQIWEQILLLEIQNRLFDSLRRDAPLAIEYFPNQAFPYLLAGIAFNEAENSSEALSYLENGLNYVIQNPNLKLEFYLQLAAAYHLEEDHSRSDAYFDKALSLNPENASALNNYAYYLAQREEKLEKAYSLSEKSNLLSPLNPVFLDTWAWVLFKQKKYAEALLKMEKVMQLSHNHDAEVLSHYAEILEANGKQADALEQYKLALTKDPDSKSLQQKINALQ
jgi:tetratricopeptide (TPR) repeat protein